MFVELPLLTRCCFCAPLRGGLLVWAYVKLVLNILIFQFGLIALWTVGIFLFFSDCVFYIFALVLSAFVLIFSDIIISFVLIVGCHKKHTTLLRLYYRCGIVHAVLFFIFSIITNVSLACITRSPGTESSEILDIILIWSSICFAILFLQMYLLLLVRSEILKLKPSGHIQFVNHIADPNCVMQVDFISSQKNKEVLPEKNLS